VSEEEQAKMMTKKKRIDRREKMDARRDAGDSLLALTARVLAILAIVRSTVDDARM
jgi:hypothetical protein